jgi:UDP-glucose 4-epimerase
MTRDTIAVTGGAGFIGSHVVDAMLAAGYDVRVLDHRPPLQTNVEWAEVDLLDQDALTDALKGCGPVFHLAAMADVNRVIADPAESVAVTVLGAARVLEAARRADAGRVILASTVWVYAATRGDVVDEDTPFDLTAERHIYASSKLAAEMFCADYAHLYGRPYTVLRYGIPYGPRMRSNLVVAAFLERALRGETLRIDGDGAQERSFVYVEDLAAAHVLALAPIAHNRTYNLEANEAISIRRLAETIGELVGNVEVTFGAARPVDYQARRVSSDRARTELGWTPRFDFAAGLQRTLEWYRAEMIAQPATPPRVAAAHRERLPRRIAIVPAYNEEPTVVAVLDELYRFVDELVVVDDGSTDGTRAEIERWLPGHERCRLLWHDVNHGMSEAYLLALTTLRARLERGELSPNDLLFTVDADGQHDLAVLGELVQATIDEGLDAMLARRDLSYHGPYKKLGNALISGWASVWAGNRLHDVESGYRIFRLGSLAHALDFYKGYKYSETVEVAVVMSRLGYRVRNDHTVPVPVSRSRTRLRDAIIDVAVIPVAAARVWRREPPPGNRSFGRDVAGHVAACSVVAVLLAIALGRSTSGVGTIGVAALAALAAAVVVRRAVPPSALAPLGPVLAAVAAWLVPQRPDLGSAAALIALFAAGAALAAPAIRRPHPFVLGISTAILIGLAAIHAREALLVVGALGVVGAAIAASVARSIRPVRRVRTLAFGTMLVLLTFGITSYFGATTVSAQWFGGGVTHGPRDSGKVAITFDDVPNTEVTPSLMRILDAAHVHATFFIVGQALEAQPQVVRALYRHGHLVANHSYHHDSWRWLDPRYPELERTQVAFEREIGACPAWFRPPNGDRTPFMARVVRQHGMRMAMWDVSDGTGHDTPDDIVQRVLRDARSGSIIDLRDGIDGAPAADREMLVRALPAILDGLRAMHLEPVRLDQLVGGPAYTSCRGRTS